MAKSLNSTARDLTIVINFTNDNLDMEPLVRWASDNCTFYAYILHDKDVNDDGILKTKHYHFICTLKRSKIRLSTSLNNIAKALNISPLCISIDKAESIISCYQYLVHKNHPLKYQYSENDIVTNLPFAERQLFIESEINEGKLNFDTLKNVCAESFGSRLYIMEKIGIGMYSKYRNVINDILGEITKVNNQFNTNF